MKDLSITQEYMICAVNEKGALSGYNQKAIACLAVSGVLEMQMEKCISLEKNKISVCAPLPAHMGYLQPLYDVINQGKPIKAEKIVETYTMALTAKKLNALTDSIMDSLKEADLLEPVKAGLLGNKEGFAPKKEVITGIIEKIRAELLEDGEISEEAAALTALMEKAGLLLKYFSKYEQKDLKDKIKTIRKSEAGTLVKDMVAYIDALDTAMISSVIVATNLT